MNPTSPPKVDWAEILEESTGLLQEYLRINTTNPPGGEEAGAVFLRDLLEAESIPCRLHDAGGSRVSLSARLEGTGNSVRKPLVLLSHIDVVPVEPKHWSHEPFGGELIDGTIWGRGALDMKGMGIMELMVMLVAKRHKLKFDRDLVFVAVADEEEGGVYGVHHLMEHSPEILKAEYTFNEGAYGFCRFMGKEAKVIGLAPSEKCPSWLKIKAVGEPGHASVPHGRSAMAHLVKALARIQDYERKAVLSEPVKAMLRTMIAKGFLPSDIDLNDQETLKTLGTLDNHLHAITHDTISVTAIHGGSKINVLPTSAEAMVDCRRLPGTGHDEFVAELKGIIDDPMIEIEAIYAHDSGISSLDTPVSAVVADVVNDHLGDDAFVLPMLTPGFTDSHAFRAAGGQAYGFTPALLTSEELGTIHGHNERLSVANLDMATQILFEVVRRLSTAN